MIPELIIDLTEMPSGQRYEDRYGAYLEIFEQIAMSERKVVVVRPPASWWPLLYYLGVYLRGSFQIYFDHCPIVEKAMTEMIQTVGDKRTAVEVLCGFRPECVDALWKIDNQWDIPIGRIRQMRIGEPKKEFIVTCNGSFWRPEVMHYLREVLPNYTPKKKKVVLVPCAADKPYPSPLHREVLKRMPADYYLAVATGVLGIVPQDLWDQMPHYDSGMPEPWRLMNVAYDYFKRNRHEHVVVYLDHYTLPIKYAFDRIWIDSFDRVTDVTFVNEAKEYHDYLDLLAPERLEQLEQSFQKEILA